MTVSVGGYQEMIQRATAAGERKATDQRTLGVRLRALELAVDYAGEERGAQRGGDDIVVLARKFETYLLEG